MPRIYEKVFAESKNFAAATASEKVTFFGTSSSILTQGRLPDGVFGRIYAISVHPKQAGTVTAAKVTDVDKFLSEASFNVYVGDRKVGGGPVKFYPAGGAYVHGNSAAGDVWFASNGLDARRLVAEIPVGALDVIEIVATGPATNLTAILAVEISLHCLVEEKGKGE